MMNIYFAGSIRAGRDDVKYYKEIISYIKKYGDVLTEHVGDYSLSLKGQTQFSDKYIHDRDVNWLLNSDVVVAEVTHPSLGVGYELATAVCNDIPIIALYRSNENPQISAMISGCDKIDTYDYIEIDDALTIIDKYLSDIK